MRLVFLFLFSCFTLFAEAPKVVVFDFGGVVAKINRKPLIEFLATSLDKPYKRVKRDFAHESLYIALEKPHSYWENYAKRPLSARWRESFEAHKRSIIKEKPEVRALIDQLKKNGIQVALLSNTRENRARFIEKAGAYDQFDPILLSCYLGVKKPDPEIYNLLLDHLKWKSGQCLFVDDRLENIIQARELGIDSILFESSDQLKRELIERGALRPNLPSQKNVRGEPSLLGDQ